MKFADFMCFEAVIPQLKADDRDGAIKELVDAIEKAGRLDSTNSAQIAQAVIKRENEASTGLGKAVAVPHVKHPAVKKIVGAVGQCPGGIDFSALDKQPVYSVIILLSPVDDPDRHLQAMEKIFRNLQQDMFRKFLRQSQTAAQIKDLFLEADEDPAI